MLVTKSRTYVLSCLTICDLLNSLPVDYRCVSAVTSTNKRVKWWSFLECLAVMGVSAAQVMFIKKMFNKNTPGIKRMV